MKASTPGYGSQHLAYIDTFHWKRGKRRPDNQVFSMRIRLAACRRMELPRDQGEYASIFEPDIALTETVHRTHGNADILHIVTPSGGHCESGSSSDRSSSVPHDTVCFGAEVSR
jgi:hypothetical protein